MLSYKAKSLSTILPKKVVADYPKFVEFMEAYYDWTLRTTFELRSVVGSFDIATHVVSLTTELTKEIEVVAESEESFICFFEDQNTFVRDESIYSYRASGVPLPYDVTDKFEHQFDEKLTNQITLFRGHTYRIRNNSGSPLFIQRLRSASTDFSYGPVTNNGASSGDIILQVTDSYPDFLFFLSDLFDTFGTIFIKDVPDAFTGVMSTLSPEFVPYGFAQIDAVLFHTEYLYEKLDTFQTINAPNALFDRFLLDRGLDSFYNTNLLNRSVFENFTEFFRKRGTEEGIRFFFRNFYGSDVSFDYPGERVLIPSESTYFYYDSIFVRATFGDEFFRNTVIRGVTSGAVGYIEGVKYSEARDFYKLFLIGSKTSGRFIVNETVKVEDIDDPTILHDVDGKILGTVINYRVVQPGNLYTLNQEIAQTFSWGGVTSLLKFTITDIGATPIRTVDIVSPGSGYAVGDVMYFPTPEKKTEFGGIFTCDTSGNRRYQSNVVRVNMEDSSLYEPIVWSGGSFNYNGTTYDILTFTSGTPATIIVDTSIATPIVTSGDSIIFDVDPDDVTDNFFDATGTVFHPQNRELKRGARAVVTTTGVSGSITGISITDPGAGYILRPTTTSGISIISTSGNGADIRATGQNYGSIVNLEQARDVVDVRFNDSITLPSNAGSDDAAQIQLEQGASVEYGQFFKDNSGFVSDKIYLQDSFFYQDYSYVIETDLSLVDYSELFKKLQHVAGEQFFNKLVIIRYFDQRLNAGASTATVLLDYFIVKEFIGALSPFTFDVQSAVNDVTVIIREAVGTVFYDRWYQDFHWASSSIEDLEGVEGFAGFEEKDITYGSGITFSGFEDVYAQSTDKVFRTSEEPPMEGDALGRIIDTVSGVGTLTYNTELCTSGFPSGVAFRNPTLYGVGTNVPFSVPGYTNPSVSKTFKEDHFVVTELHLGFEADPLDLIINVYSGSPTATWGQLTPGTGGIRLYGDAPNPQIHHVHTVSGYYPFLTSDSGNPGGLDGLQMWSWNFTGGIGNLFNTAGAGITSSGLAHLADMAYMGQTGGKLWIALCGATKDDLRTYAWDVGTQTWTKEGTDFTMSFGANPDVRLASYGQPAAGNNLDRIVMLRSDATNPRLTTYEWDETLETWSTYGNTLSLGSGVQLNGDITNIGPARISMVATEPTGTTLRIYEQPNNDWKLVSNEYAHTLSGVTTSGLHRMATVGNNRVVIMQFDNTNFESSNAPYISAWQYPDRDPFAVNCPLQQNTIEYFTPLADDFEPPTMINNAAAGVYSTLAGLAEDKFVLWWKDEDAQRANLQTYVLQNETWVASGLTTSGTSAANRGPFNATTQYFRFGAISETEIVGIESRDGRHYTYSGGTQWVETDEDFNIVPIQVILGSDFVVVGSGDYVYYDGESPNGSLERLHYDGANWTTSGANTIVATASGLSSRNPGAVAVINKSPLRVVHVNNWTQKLRTYEWTSSGFNLITDSPKIGYMVSNGDDNSGDVTIATINSQKVLLAMQRNDGTGTYEYQLSEMDLTSSGWVVGNTRASGVQQYSNLVNSAHIRALNNDPTSITNERFVFMPDTSIFPNFPSSGVNHVIQTFEYDSREVNFYGPELSMSGVGTNWTSIPSGLAYDDIIHASGYDFLVKEVVSDTEVVVQRLNTTGSTPVTLAGVSYTFTRKRRADLIEARLLDILYFGDVLTASGYINDTISDWTRTIQVNQ